MPATVYPLTVYGPVAYLPGVFRTDGLFPVCTAYFTIITIKNGKIAE